MFKTEIPGIYKASDGILINKDNDSLRKYRKRREILKAKDSKINTLEDRVNSLSCEMEEIRTLLKKLANNK